MTTESETLRNAALSLAVSMGCTFVTPEHGKTFWKCGRASSVDYMGTRKRAYYPDKYEAAIGFLASREALPAFTRRVDAEADAARTVADLSRFIERNIRDLNFLHACAALVREAA